MRRKAGGGRAFIDLDAEEFAHPNLICRCGYRSTRKARRLCAAGHGERSRGACTTVLCLPSNIAALRLSGSQEKLELLHVVGGGSKSSVLCQWIADAIGVHVKRDLRKQRRLEPADADEGSRTYRLAAGGRQIAARSANTRIIILPKAAAGTIYLNVI